MLIYLINISYSYFLNISGGKLPHEQTYLSMVLSAFDDSSNLTQDESKSIHQYDMIDWIARTYYSNLEDIQLQALKKSIYNSLTKNFERVVGVQLEGKRQKRGTVRWRKVPVNNSEACTEF